MYKRLIFLVFIFCVSPLACLRAQTVFDKFFAQAQAFDEVFPREKVYLHFDNTSYYQGDTIRYQAFVVEAKTLQPSHISRPLYVDFADQMGNVHERQIVKLTNGMGTGQISLANTFFTGFYEVRAYTKWMLAFGEDPQYFSRTFPIYRKRLSPTEPRSIAEYRMDKSMMQRPAEKVKGLSARFYPEGGQLVEGITSVVGVETFNADSGWVNISGFLLNEKGERTTPLATIHDGMGTFLYTPGATPTKVEFDYNGKTHRFTLPEAKKEGFVMRVNTKQDEIEVRIDAAGNNLPTALFIFSQGTPVNYIPITTQHLRIPVKELPAGVIRLSLINTQGKTLADRYCFVMPDAQAQIQVNTDKPYYMPHEKATCRLRLTSANGQPLAGIPVALSIRDGMENDSEDDSNNILTDLLLTSNLRGYIHQPGFYLSDRSAQRRKLLDNLLLIRGQSHYDLGEAIGTKPFSPHYLPEEQLTLYGQVHSWFGKQQRGIGVTILAQNDSVNIAGSTVTDSLGYFSVPIDDFTGRMEALIQTRYEGKQFNRNTSVSLFRNFEPPLRALDYRETHLIKEQGTMDNGQENSLISNALLDSLYNISDSLYDDVKEIEEIVVTAKRKRYDINKATQAFERNIVAYYNIRQIVDRMRDEGKTVVDDLGYLFYQLNPKKFDRDGTRYGTAPLRYSINGQSIDQSFVNHSILERVQTALLYQDQFRKTSYSYAPENYRVKENEMQDFFTHSAAETDTINFGQQRETYIRCDLTVDPGFEAWRSYKPTHGIRHTYIQGYENPLPTSQGGRGEGMFVTDENGEIVVEVQTGNNPTFLLISAEALANGKPTATSVKSISVGKKP